MDFNKSNLKNNNNEAALPVLPLKGNLLTRKIQENEKPVDEVNELKNTSCLLIRR